MEKENSKILDEDKIEKVSGGDLIIERPKAPVTCFSCHSGNVESIKSEYNKTLNVWFITYRCKDCGYEFKKPDK